MQGRRWWQRWEEGRRGIVRAGGEETKGKGKFKYRANEWVERRKETRRIRGDKQNSRTEKFQAEAGRVS